MSAVAAQAKTRKRKNAGPAAGRIKLTCHGPDESIQVPGWVRDLETFRRWVTSDEVPEKTRVVYLDGEIWMDLSMEQAFTHNAVKTEYTVALSPIAKKGNSGMYFSDGMLLSNTFVELSTVPDGIFVATATLESGRVRLVPGKLAGFVELEGTPDMALEVVSDSSWEKDLVVLRDLYWRTEIPEYWLVDAREEVLQFDILRRGEKSYVATRKRDGWLKSAVFGKSFKLTRAMGKLGHPEFTLLVK